MPDRYILSNAVITTEGYYFYYRVSIQAAIDWLKKGPYISTVGYEETADAMQNLFGIKFEINRKMIKMAPDDEALVFRLTRRMKKPDYKTKIGREFIINNCEIGILRKGSMF